MSLGSPYRLEVVAIEIFRAFQHQAVLVTPWRVVVAPHEQTEAKRVVLMLRVRLDITLWRIAQDVLVRSVAFHLILTKQFPLEGPWCKSSFETVAPIAAHRWPRPGRLRLAAQKGRAAEGPRPK